MSHPLHVEVATFLKSIALPVNYRLVLAPECGGTHNLPLFSSEQKSNDTEYCNVDVLVVKDAKVCFLLEIEESGLMPTKVCGKFLTSALSSHFIHDALNNTATPMDSKITFVQVMDAKKLELHTKKISQGQLLEDSIKAILPIRSVSTYRLFFFRGAEEFRSDQQKKANLREVYLKACGCADQADINVPLT